MSNCTVEVTAGLNVDELEAELNAARQELLSATVVPPEFSGTTLEQLRQIAATAITVQPQTSGFSGAEIYGAVVVLGPPALAALKAYFDYLSAKVRARRGSGALNKK